MAAPDTHPATLAAALAELQTQLPHVGKGKTAKVVTKDKGSYSYTYADLAIISRELLPLMGKLGLSFTCRPTMTEAGAFILDYMLMHEGGETIAGAYPLPTSGTPQQVGSAITYARRYCLCAVTGLAADDDDDDGAAAEKAPAQQEPEPQRPRRNQDDEPPAERRQTTPAQIINIKWKELGIDDRDERLTLTGKLAGREITSTNDLTTPEQARVMRLLRGCTDISQVHALIDKGDKP